LNVYGAFILNLARLLAKRRLDGKLCGHLADHQEWSRNSGFSLIFFRLFSFVASLSTLFNHFQAMYNMGIVHYRDPERRFDSVVRVIVKIF